jgi:hypothetical protein
LSSCDRLRTELEDEETPAIELGRFFAKRGRRIDLARSLGVTPMLTWGISQAYFHNLDK